MEHVKHSRSKIVRDNIELIVRAELFQDNGGNDRVRIEAYLSINKDDNLVAGADILLYPPNPLISVVPHNTSFIKKGVALTMTAILIGAAGPLIGACIDDGDERQRFQVRRCVASKIQDIVDVAFLAAWDQMDEINDLG